MNSLYAREQKRELVNILLDSVYYLDLCLAERNKLVCYLLTSFTDSAAGAK